MHLLLTRPRPDAERTRARLEAAGHRATISPVMGIVALEARWPPGVSDALVATSAHAFDLGKVAGLPLPEARRTMPLLLVGERAEAAARRCGFTGDAIVAGTAAELVGRLGRLAREWRRFVYLAGRDRKPDLEKGLRASASGELGLAVVEVYEAAPTPALEQGAAAMMRAGTFDGVLHFSRRSASLFLQLARQDGLPTHTLCHFCLSEEVAGPLRETGHSAVTVAAAPNEAALLASLTVQA